MPDTAAQADHLAVTVGRPCRLYLLKRGLAAAAGLLARPRAQMFLRGTTPRCGDSITTAAERHQPSQRIGNAMGLKLIRWNLAR